MSDFGKNPAGIRHDMVVPGVATVTGIKFGDVVVIDRTGSATDHKAVKLPTAAGENYVRGICVSQTDPSSGSAVGDVLEICVEGIAECNIVASQALTAGDELVTSTTPGAAKKLASETTPDVIGRTVQDLASTAAVTRVGVELHIRRNPA